ncbi:MAG: aminotransferase class I/II-fold pyridoxal phosphate-dependent enzyme [Bacillota bacterium]|nr:aminotransferase class I/II-fold pyridoxal phosphate-dependent enzyme [Bacillota bacterium]
MVENLRLEIVGLGGGNIFLGNGAAEVIFTIAQALKPVKALIPAPTFAEYEIALRSVDTNIEYYMMNEDADFQIGEDILEYLDRDVDIFFLCNPNNPTGAITDKRRIKAIIARCKELNITVVLDECFLDFADNKDELTLFDELATNEHLIILKAFTKLYAMAGVRLGYCLCADHRLIERMEDMVQPWNVSTLAQEAGIAALRQGEYVKNSLEFIGEEKIWLKESLEKLGLKVWNSQGNYLFFKGSENLGESLKKMNIIVRDCSNYVGLEKGYYRTAIKLHHENERLIYAIDYILKIER